MIKTVAVLFGFLAVLCFSEIVTSGATTVIDGTVVDTRGDRYYLGGSFNFLIITNGGVLRTGFVDIGETAGDRGNEAVVTGTNSLWAAGASMFVGVGGPNNSVTVSQGGTLSIREPHVLILGSFASSTGNSLKILDGGNVFATSVLATRGSIILSNGVLGVDSLGTANASKLMFASGLLSTTNGVSIDHGITPFVVGTTPNGTSTWQIRGGDNIIVATNGFLLGGLNGTTNTITITGPGAILKATGPMYLGSNGTSAGQSSIMLTAGTGLEANIMVGALDGSGSITNLGGIFQFTTARPTITNVSVGSIFGSNATVSFRNVSNAPVSIRSGMLTNIFFFGDRALRLNNSTNELAPDFLFQSVLPTNYNRLELVGGINQWNGSNLTIGPRGSMLISNCVPSVLPNRGRLTILDNSRLVYDGDRNNFNSSVSNLTVMVSGTNAQWYNQRSFTLGSSGGKNLFIVTNGASLITTIDFSIGYYITSSSNSLIVAGAGSLWNNGGGVDLGLGSPGNQIKIMDGATAVANCVLGNSNNTMTVTGNGTTYFGSASVGGNHDRLEISDGATAQLGGITIGYDYGTTGNVVSVTKGNLIADMINVGFYGQGDLSLNRGSLSVNALIQNAGNIYFNSGIMNAYYSQVTFVVGDGVQPARLNLTGSFHTGTITVSPNACLSGLASYGLGGIQNNVTNYGTIAPGNPVGEMSILYANLSLQPSSTLIFKLRGTNQGVSYSDLLVTYAVQFGGNLRIRLLNGFKPLASDVFTLMTFGSGSGAFADVASGSRAKSTDNLGSFQVDYAGIALVLTNYQTTDTDGDGVDDAWALQYFDHTPLTGAEKQADADGDGLSNYAEFLAETSPVNPASVFKITSVTLDSTGAVILQFNAVAEKTYLLSCSDDFVSWNLLDMPLLAWVAPGTYQWIDDGTETGTPPKKTRFYRVTVAP